MIIRPARYLKGTVSVPGDKSISHRAAILAAMAKGETRITNFSTAEDCHTTLRCLEQLGVTIRRDGNDMTVSGVGKRGFRRPDEPLDCGNSGTTARLLAGVLAGQSFDSVLTGDRSLSSRPMQRVIEPLMEMGAAITSNDGRLPLKISGRPLHGIRYELPVASAQLKSCLLLAGLLAEGQTTVIETAPTRDHTERMLRSLGVNIEEKHAGYTISGSACIEPGDISVPADTSSAAFFAGVAACLDGSDLTISNVGLNPTRTAFIDLLASLDAPSERSDLEENNNEPSGALRIRGGLDRTRRLMISGDEVATLIDELPLLAVVGTHISSVEVRDASELRHKETDRISATVENLRRMGANVKEYADGYHVRRSQLQGATVDAFGDHRIAMAFAVAGLLADGETAIDGARCVDISFPGFFDTLATVVCGL